MLVTIEALLFSIEPRSEQSLAFLDYLLLYSSHSGENISVKNILEFSYIHVHHRNVNVQRHTSGHTPLHKALLAIQKITSAPGFCCVHKNPDLERAIVEHTTYGKDSPLLSAVPDTEIKFSRLMHIVSLLIEYGADIDIADKLGVTSRAIIASLHIEARLQVEFLIGSYLEDRIVLNTAVRLTV
jgi:ankyrin repeat protein